MSVGVYRVGPRSLGCYDRRFEISLRTWMVVSCVSCASR